MKPFLFFCLVAGLSFGAIAQPPSFNILAYGAVPDGKTSSTAAIQRAIDVAHQKGGGIVEIPAGQFVTAVLTLKSGVSLHLASGAVLMGSASRIDYGPSDASALIVAQGQHNIGITGSGTIDGQGPLLLKDIYRMLHAGTLDDKEWQTENPWHQVRPEERNRPKVIEFKDCDSISIKGLTIKDGLCWVQNYKNCSNLIVDSIRVESNIFWNNDGIDLVDCTNASVTNSFFNADDDGICLKSEDRHRRCENIYIANCTIRSSASALKFGTASWGGFKNIRVNNIKVYDTYRSAIALEVVDGGIMEDIDIRNVIATNTGNAIFIRLGHRNKDSVISQLRRVHITGVKAVIPAGKPDKGYPMEGPALGFPHNGFPASVAGLAGHPVQDVVLDSIDITYEGLASKDSAFVGIDGLASIPENAGDYPEFSMFGELPAWGWYMRHATGVTVKNSRLRFTKEDFRAAMVFDDVQGLQIYNTGIATGHALPLLVFRNTKNVVMKGLQLPIKNKKAILYLAKQ